MWGFVLELVGESELVTLLSEGGGYPPTRNAGVASYDGDGRCGSSGGHFEPGLTRMEEMCAIVLYIVPGCVHGFLVLRGHGCGIRAPCKSLQGYSVVFCGLDHRKVFQVILIKQLLIVQ